jgi:hypothetical protein
MTDITYIYNRYEALANACSFSHFWAMRARAKTLRAILLLSRTCITCLLCICIPHDGGDCHGPTGKQDTATMAIYNRSVDPVGNLGNQQERPNASSEFVSTEVESEAARRSTAELYRDSNLH